MSIWLELWKRPGHATFGRLQNDVPARSGGFTDTLNGIGSGSATVPSSWPYFDEVLLTDPDTAANSTVGLFRWYSSESPTTPIFEWEPTSLLPAGAKNEHTVDVSGNGMKGVLSKARLEPWDWDGTDVFAPNVPDWVYGGNQILQNGGFETTPLPNGGFEDGTNDYWETTQDDGVLNASTGMVAVNNPAGAESGDWYGLVNPTGNMSGAQRTISGLTVGNIYQITGFLMDPTASGDRFRAGVTDVAKATHLNAYREDDYWWAELDNVPMGTGASDGTWQSFTLMFLASSTTAKLVIVYSEVGAGPDFRIDTWNIEGDGVGLYPWEPRYPDRTNFFGYETSIVHSGVSSVQVQGNDLRYVSPFGVSGYGRIGIQQAKVLKVGQPYKASVWVRQDSGSTQRFDLAIIRQSPKGVEGSPGSSFMAAEIVDIPSGVWTQITLPFVADVQEVFFYVSWMYTGAFDDNLHPSPTYYVDDAQLFEGLVPTTVGDILLQLYRDATSDHPPRVVWDDDANPGTPYLTPDFTELVDSAGQPWDNSELEIRLTMRMSYSQIMAEFANSYGYEYRIIPDDPEAGTWLWQVFNPGTLGTDRTGLPGPAIQGGSTDTQRSLRRFSPSTDLMVEGVGRITSRARNATLITALGRNENSKLDREAAGEDGASAAASEGIAAALISGASYSYTLVEPDVEPLSGYELGDLLNIIDPPELDETAARFVGLTVSTSPDGTEWEVQFGQSSITGQAAVAQAVADILAKFEYPDELGTGGGATLGGEAGMITVGVAAADASQTSKDKADFLCTGSEDDQTIMAALEACHTAGGGTVWLSEGNYIVEPDQIIVGFSQSYPVPMTLRGMGYGTVLKFVSFTDFVVFVAQECAVRDLTIDLDTG